MSKSYDSARELEYINYIPGNNSLNFTATVIGNGAPIVDATAGIYANGAFEQSNAAFIAANTANAAIANVNVYGANTSVTSYFAIPQGNTAQRPAAAANGHIRYNTTLGQLETYLPSSGWTSLAQDRYTVEYVIVAGGGGGAARIGSGGGAGYNGPSPASGGNGGAGPAGPSSVGTPGTTNTGGGGGGGVYDGNAGHTGGAGGSGVVILAYISPVQRATGGTVTNVNLGSTTRWIHTFTGSGTFTA